jgi:hypothetical protein
VPKESCLHCRLLETMEKWIKSHNCSTEEFLSMVAKFAAEATLSRPEYQHFEEAKIVILGIEMTHDRGSLH